MKLLLFICSLFVITTGKSQPCKIKFFVKDAQTGKPIGTAEIEEGNKNIGLTSNDGTYVTSSRNSSLYTFTIKKDGYEVWEDYSVNALPEITPATIELTSLSYRRAQLFGELKKKETANAQKVDLLYKNINKSYDILNDNEGKKQFIDLFNAYKKENDLDFKTANGDIIKITKGAQKNMQLN